MRGRATDEEKVILALGNLIYQGEVDQKAEHHSSRKQLDEEAEFDEWEDSIDDTIANSCDTSEVEAEKLRRICSIGPKAMQNILKRLQRGNYIRRRFLDRKCIGDEMVSLREHGIEFYHQLLGESS